MTDTGQIPGEGLPENGVGETGLPPHTGLDGNGVPQQAGWAADPAAGHGVPAPGYTFLDQPTAGPALDDEDDALLMPGPQGAWTEAPHAVPPHGQPQHPAQAQLHFQPQAPLQPQPQPSVVNVISVEVPTEVPVEAPILQMPAAARRPLHMGPPVTDTPSGGVSVRSLADRGPAVVTSGPPTSGPEYLDVPRDEAIPAQQTGEPAATEWPQAGGPSMVSLIPHADSVIPAQASAPAVSQGANIPSPAVSVAPPAPADGPQFAEAAPQAQVPPVQESAAAGAPAAAPGSPDSGAAPAPAHAPASAEDAPAPGIAGATAVPGIPAPAPAAHQPGAPGAEAAAPGPVAPGLTAVPGGPVAPVPAAPQVPAVTVVGEPAAAAPAAAAQSAAPGLRVVPEPTAAADTANAGPAQAPSAGVASEAVPAAVAVPAPAGAPAAEQAPEPPAPATEQEAPPAAPAAGAAEPNDGATPGGSPDAAQEAPAPAAAPAAGTGRRRGPAKEEPVTLAEAVPLSVLPHAADAEAGETATAAAPAAAQAPAPARGRRGRRAAPAAEPEPAEVPEPVAVEPPAAAPVAPAAVAAEPAATELPVAEPVVAEPAAAEPAEVAAAAAVEPAPEVQAAADAPAVETAAEPVAATAVETGTADEGGAPAGDTAPEGQAEAGTAAAAESGDPAEPEEPEEIEAAAETAAPVAARSQGPAAEPYEPAVRDAVHRVIRERRDIRNGFRSDPIPHEVLLRVLEAAHTAPSVGHSQPWDFVVIRSAKTRERMHALAMEQRDAYAKSLPKARARQFRELKIEAILDTPVNIVVTADPTRGGRHTLGRHTQPQMAPYSSALAVENLWLAARAEGLGVGWVSFFDERQMVEELGLPDHLEVVAYLCVGYVDEFPEEPELMQAGWSQRRPLSWVVHEEEYGNRALPGEEPHDLLEETLRGIRPLDAKALGEAWERQKRMTKPAGALGMLEIISAQLSGLSRKCPPPIPEPAAVAIFAGDHGVHAQGVTAWPQEVTGQMVANFLGGGAVCNAFANQVGAEVCVIDVGVASELPTTPGLLPRKVRPGTADFTTGPAMSRDEALRAIEVGIETARDLVAAGNKALLTGEMGIANTTTSAALIAVFTGVDPAEVTGRGTGINDEMHARKVDVVRRALDLHRPDPADPIAVLTAVGGLEHAAMVGLLLGAAALRTPVILDGVSAGAAALVARAIAPEVLAACIAGHRSAEPGHMAALTTLGLRPLVDLDLRLGEGTGALLALPLVQSAARVMHEVATFDAAGVTEKA
ncbi:nicotinate-nucleotide-dimethylbenzimidazole phosphoribosyltransferase /cob(II)yrinic acid a,c-diamide reductase [Actinacidiphila rubida]|uniref:Nicotinate-nucleotide--dimethylbenzimidazole phosphoribosyltransferase n=1 Tax=Actinacidiphila rubida TaxID=310780 RepID=A0A1H8PEA9_9ACTN|nr:nicotinate-nucleotide--dimethylbenzimidazole phosphoribosyltransferase [Actinacidiphila rubida]SEO39863.1 nicotinate-nucleotide-dimethylbenzimidazole phosphoribosyltransferase /cob(II)yrinic acid a,c-diamide reductase [Actinacidiphila rubida]